MNKLQNNTYAHMCQIKKIIFCLNFIKIKSIYRIKSIHDIGTY